MAPFHEVLLRLLSLTVSFKTYFANYLGTLKTVFDCYGNCGRCFKHGRSMLKKHFHALKKVLCLLEFSHPSCSNPKRVTAKLLQLRVQLSPNSTICFLVSVAVMAVKWLARFANHWKVVGSIPASTNLLQRTFPSKINSVSACTLGNVVNNISELSHDA